ncbi:MAG TPA: thiamine pyrophosphate-dependent dehydrogenase E1 component subunit alpha [Acidobacteriota bacterium]|nr:thiamine pyrophosphate-dependent dehydrogenase E1 component subunit alpha [Acidobacteriota bacterium]
MQKRPQGPSAGQLTPYSRELLERARQLGDFDPLKAYWAMLQTRLVDEFCLRLQRQGRLAFYAGSSGEEAAVVGSAAALQNEDFIFPSYREVAAAFYRGYSPRAFFCQLLGNRRDTARGRQMPLHFTAAEINFGSGTSPVGTQIPQAVGYAMGLKIQERPGLAITYFGEGTTSTGDFHVGLNFAGVYQVPVLFFCRNNQWAISVPLEMQTASPDIACKAQAYGFNGVKVDGTNLLEVYCTCRQLAERARRHYEPALIEAFMFRLGAHSTSDDPSAYQPDGLRDSWAEHDPVQRMREFLLEQELLGREEEDLRREKLQAQLKADFAWAQEADVPEKESLFEDVYARMPSHLREQCEDALL